MGSNLWSQGTSNPGDSDDFGGHSFTWTDPTGATHSLTGDQVGNAMYNLEFTTIKADMNRGSDWDNPTGSIYYFHFNSSSTFPTKYNAEEPLVKCEYSYTKSGTRYTAEENCGGQMVNYGPNPTYDQYEVYGWGWGRAFTGATTTSVDCVLCREQPSGSYAGGDHEFAHAHTCAHKPMRPCARMLMHICPCPCDRYPGDHVMAGIGIRSIRSSGGCTYHGPCSSLHDYALSGGGSACIDRQFPIADLACCGNGNVYCSMYVWAQ